MNIKIDGKQIELTRKEKNIVDAADQAGIGIPAPCYRNGRKQGCCNACVVEVNGKQQYACATKPEEGMDITVNREDLKKLRQERLQKYRSNIENGNSCGCSCSADSGCC